MYKFLLVVVAAVSLSIFVGCPANNCDHGNRSHWDRQDYRMKEDLLREHNYRRANPEGWFAKEARPLRMDRELANAAQDWAENMASRNQLCHGDLKSKVSRNWQYLGENVAWGQSDAKEVTEDWMNSRDHKKNIMNDDFDSVGFGIARSKDRRLYWCAIFGRR